MRNCTTACVRQPAAKVLRHTADCSGLVRQDLDETVLSATVAADPVSPHWLILTPSKVVRVAMDQVQPAHSAAITAQSPAASRRPAVSQALSHLTGVLLLMHPPIHPFKRLFIGVFIHPPMPWSCDVHACNMYLPQGSDVQSYIAPCMHSSPQMHVATSSSHCMCLASCANACQRSRSSGPIVLQKLHVVMYHSPNCGVSPAAQSLPARTASPDLPA